MKQKISRDSKYLEHFDASRADFAPYGFTCELWSAEAMPRADRHNEVEINFLSSGSLTYLMGGRRETIEHSRLTMFWGALPHQIITYETCRPYHVVTIPLVSFLRVRFPPSLVRLVMEGDIVSDPDPEITDARAFERWVGDLQSGEALRERAAEMEIHSRLLRLALALPVRKGGARKESSASTINSNLSRADQIACYIARHYMQPLSAEDIGQAVGLHPNYAMALFRQTFGTTITEFLLQNRLSHAQRLLVTTDEPIIEVGPAAGFQSVSRFNEVFKEVCGCAPREYRKTHQKAFE